MIGQMLGGEADLEFWVLGPIQNSACVWADWFWFQFKIHHLKFKIFRRGSMDCVLLVLCFYRSYECC
jgi:hypothetical protein